MTARHGVHLFAGLNVTLNDVLERSVVDSARPLSVNDTWLEQHFVLNGNFQHRQC